MPISHLLKITDPKYISAAQTSSLESAWIFTFSQFCKADVCISLDQKNIPSAPGFGFFTYIIEN